MWIVQIVHTDGKMYGGIMVSLNLLPSVETRLIRRPYVVMVISTLVI